MINIHVVDRELLVLSPSKSNSLIIKHIPIENCFEIMRKIKEIIEKFLSEGYLVFVLTGNISIALEVKKDPVISRTIYEIAHKLIEHTLYSCFKPFSRRRVFDNPTNEATSLIPNSSRLVSIGEKDFNSNLSRAKVKKLLRKEYLSTTNPPTDIRNRTISKALQPGGWVDMLYQLHDEFFSTPQYKSGKFFVLSEVDTMCDDGALKERYSNMVMLLAYKPSLSSDVDDFVVVDPLDRKLEEVSGIKIDVQNR